MSHWENTRKNATSLYNPLIYSPLSSNEVLIQWCKILSKRQDNQSIYWRKNGISVKFTIEVSAQNLNNESLIQYDNLKYITRYRQILWKVKTTFNIVKIQRLFYKLAICTDKERNPVYCMEEYRTLNPFTYIYYLYISTIIIIIKSRYFYEFPRQSLLISLYHPLLPAGPPDYILYPYRVVVGKFLMIGQRWHVHVKGSIGERHLRVRPCFSNKCPTCLVRLSWLYIYYLVLYIYIYIYIRARKKAISVHPFFRGPRMM